MASMQNNIRKYSQFFFLSLIVYVATRPLFDKAYIADFEQYCPLGGISSLFSKLSQGTMACSMSETQVILGIGLLLCAGLLGKLFCSFICPIGTVSEWIGRLGEKLHLRRQMPDLPDRFLRVGKYLVLFMVIYFTMTSSELFCKKFDPYFATVNLFSNGDISLYFAIAAFVITILGAFFFRLFWCKYLCPLSAASNIFLNAVFSGGVILVYLLLNFYGAGLGYTWLLVGLVLSGVVNEVGFMRSRFLPLPKISRNELTCTHCTLCTPRCPQGIKIAGEKKINHIDCNLCSDCLYACPKEQTITMNGKKSLKHLAPITMVIVVVLSLTAANFYELSTVSLRWGSQPVNSAVFTQQGIKTIKCYGSSMALAGTLQEIPGIYGLDTYAKSHTAIVYYDPTVISAREVHASLFTPAKTEIYDVQLSQEKYIGVFSIAVNGFFDAIDYNNLFTILKSTQAICGFETRFGEPVQVTMYIDSGKITPRKILDLIQSKSLTLQEGAISKKLELNFTPEGSGSLSEMITPYEYKKRIFIAYDDVYSRFDAALEKDYAMYKLFLPEAGYLNLREKFPFFSSHLSADEGIVRIQTKYEGEPVCYIYFDSKKTSFDAIKHAVNQPNLTYFISDTESETIPNPFANLQNSPRNGR